MSQERGKRGGTESTVLLVGLGKAAEILHMEGDALRSHMKEMRDRLADALVAALPNVRRQELISASFPSSTFLSSQLRSSNRLLYSAWLAGSAAHQRPKR